MHEPPNAFTAHPAAPPQPRLEPKPGPVLDVVAVEEPKPVDAVQFLVPTKTSIWALISCYTGFCGMLFPLIGLPFAIIGLITGVVALAKWKKGTSYGSITSNIRAIIGVVCSIIGLSLWGTILVIIFFNR